MLAWFTSFAAADATSSPIDIPPRNASGSLKVQRIWRDIDCNFMVENASRGELI